MGKDVKSMYIAIGIVTAIATILGVFGQAIANGLHHMMSEISSVNFLTGVTVFSIVCYISAFGLSVKTNTAKAYTLVIIVAGVMVSAWSLFVLLMWWG